MVPLWAPFLSFLFLATRTLATVFDKVVDVLLAVVVRYFFARLYLLAGTNVDAVIFFIMFSFGVRLASVIDVTSFVAVVLAIDNEFVSDCK